MTNSTAIPGSKVGRARRRLSQLWQVPAFLIGLLAFLGVAASAPWRSTPQAREVDKLIVTLRAGIEHDESGDSLVEYAERVLARVLWAPSRAGEIRFLAGTAYYRQAQQKPAAFAKQVWPRAAEHLQEALDLGVSDADRPALQYRLGFALYQQNKEALRALELMTAGAERGADQPVQAYQLLVRAHLKQAEPKLDVALAASLRLLDLTPERDVDAMAQARLQHGEILLLKESRAEAIKVLERIGPKASRELRIRARLVQARCCEEEGLWSNAILIWQELLADAPQVEGGRARIYYALGWCHHQLEPPNDTETIRAWSEALKFGGPEAQAAGLRLGLLRLPRGDKEAEQALADWKTALEKVSVPADFHNPHMELKQVKEWFDRAIQQFDEAQDPIKTQAVAELYRKIAPGGVAEYQIGQAAEANAKLLADKLQAMFDNVKAADVAAQFRRAGDAFEQAAHARSEGERPESLWRSAQCYLAAKEAARAQQLLNQYVKIETNEARLAEAWYLLGDLYRGEGRKIDARTAFLKCIETPNTRFAYRSRYFLAIEKIESKEFEEALVILKQNDSPPDIERPWQEKSLFKMASLLMMMKKYGEAHFHLKECLRLFPENQNVLLAREQLGECYRRLAEQEQRKEDEIKPASTVGLSDERRLTLEENLRHHRLKRKEWLKEAGRTYEELADELEKTLARLKQLSNIEQVLLRRAWFGIGECHLDNQEYAPALRIFESLQAKHRRTLEGFYASLRICNLAEAMGQGSAQGNSVRELAKGSVRMLTEDVKALPADHELFRMPGVSSREDWLRWADTTQRKLLAPPKTDSGLPAFR